MVLLLNIKLNLDNFLRDYRTAAITVWYAQECDEKLFPKDLEMMICGFTGREIEIVQTKTE